MAAKKKASKKTKPAAATRKSSARRSAKPKATPKRRKATKAIKATKATKASRRSKAKPKATTAAKPKPKRKPAIAAKPKTRARPSRRRDATGHLDPQYAADLRAIALETRDTDADQQAFVTGARSTDELAEERGEEAVTEMTSGEDQRERLLDEQVDDERGGPFVETGGSQEYAGGTDASNPASATREPFPTT